MLRYYFSFLSNRKNKEYLFEQKLVFLADLDIFAATNQKI